MRITVETPLGSVSSKDNPNATVEQFWEVLEPIMKDPAYLVLETNDGKVILPESILKNSIIWLTESKKVV